MGRGRGLLTWPAVSRVRRVALVLAAIGAFGAEAARAQESLPAPRVGSTSELPPEVQVALRSTQDLAFNFDQPGFYALVRWVQQMPHSPGFAQAPVEVTNWQDLLERPADFRGRVVTITGVVGRNKVPYTLRSAPDIAPLSQLELHQPDQPLACTAILTQAATDIPLGTTVRITGYFLMVRQYYEDARHVRQAALVIAPGPTELSRAQPLAGGEYDNPLDWRWVLAAIGLGLLITILLLRWNARAPRTELRDLHASHAAPTSLAEDLAQWARRDEDDTTSPERRDTNDL
jgi:hypothetical protein